MILYRAGRTAAGAKASASHTASIAGDYVVTRELARAAGVVVAESLSDFDDLVRLFTLLRDKSAGGTRLGAVSNAGFECVAIADNLGAFDLPAFDADTSASLDAIFREARIDSVVDVHNPSRPDADDRRRRLRAGRQGGHERPERRHRHRRVRAADLGAEYPAARTRPPRRPLPAGGGRSRGWGDLKRELAKAWVAVVDAGVVYDPLVRLLDEDGVPTFRTADTALRLLNVFAEARRRQAGPAAG